MSRVASPPGVDRRQDILRAALDVFAEHDFAEATTKTIAQRAGVTQGLIYFYFPGGKEELFHAAFEQEADRALAELDLCALLRSDGPPEAVLRRAVARLVEVLEGPAVANLTRIAMKAQMCPTRPGDGHAERYRPMRTLGEPLALALRDYLAEQIARGAVRPLDAGLVAQVITNALLTTMVRRTRGEDPLSLVPRADLVDAISGLFLHGVLPPAAGSGEEPPEA